jgi:hypothetical protein
MASLPADSTIYMAGIDDKIGINNLALGNDRIECHVFLYCFKHFETKKF